MKYPDIIIQSLRLNFSMRFLIVSLLLFILYKYSNTCAGQLQKPDPLSEFYTLANELKTASVAQKIESLKQYIELNPGIELGYQQLTETYLYNSMLKEGIEYFRFLTDKEKFEMNAAWVLARFYFIVADYSNAYTTLTKSVLNDSVSPKIISDFIELGDKIRFAKENHLVELDVNVNFDKIEYKLSNESQKLFRFYRQYHNSNFPGALKQYNNLETKLRRDYELIFNHGYCFLRMNNGVKADSVWKSGLKLAIRQGHHFETARFNSLIGTYLNEKAIIDSALYHFESAMNIAIRYEGYTREIIVSRNKALIYTQSKDDDNEAIDYLLNSLNISKKINDYKYISLCCINLGIISRRLGEFQQALDYIEMGENCALKALDFISLLQLKQNKGNLYFDNLKQYALAKKYYNDALVLAKILKYKNIENRIQASLTNILIHEKKYTHAKEKYIEIISTMKGKSEFVQKSIYLSRLADVYIKENHFEKAKEISLQAYSIAKQVDSKVYMSYYLYDIARLDLVLGNTTEAITSLQHILKDMNIENNLDLLSLVYLKLGTAYKKLGDLDTAVQQYARAVEIIEKSRATFKADRYRIGYFSTKYETFQKLMECFLERYFVDKKNAELDSLFYYTQMSRDRELKDRIFTTGQNNKNAPFTDENFLKADLALRKKQYQIRKNSYTAEIDWERQASELEAAKYTLITQRIKSFESLQSELNLVKSHIPTLKEIEKQLEKNGRGMLIYHFSEDMSFVFAVTGDSCKVVKLDVELDTLSATIDRMMTPFHNVQQDFIQDIPFKADIAYKLYTWLFEPIQNSIRLPNQLLILPDNAIINLPFELLLTQKPAKTHYSPSDKPTYVENFLVHQYSFVYNPTLTNPPQKRYNMSNKPNLLVYANPFYMPRMDIHPLLSLRQFSGWRFDPLPFAELEAERIKQYYPHTKIIKREQALETRFKEEADRYEIIHLATHAFVDSTFDAFSGLAFSLGADSTDDGLLMGYEISDLDLSCDLVTLSACETGRGKLMEGEGVLGLPRQFLAAGSKSVLMTLWKVDDKFTSQLMPEFYDFYLNKKMSKADALENAKHNMLSLKPSSQGIYYQHPFYWASFVLYGDPGDRKPSMNMVFTLVSLSVVMGISFFFQFNIYTRKQKS